MKLDATKQKGLAEKMRPKTEDEFEAVFFRWIGQFTRKYLSIEKLSGVAKQLFVIKPVDW